MIDTLLARNATNSPRIAVIGDSMIDCWHHGELQACQDGCPKFVENHLVHTPGGAANAARQLHHWNADVYLISPVDHFFCSHFHLNTKLCHECRSLPRKRRYLQDGRIIWRHDAEPGYGFSPNGLAWSREMVVKAVATMKFDAVLVSDYDKGFLDNLTINNIIRACRQQKIPVVSDPKRASHAFGGSIIKCNADYFNRNPYLGLANAVITSGARSPILMGNGKLQERDRDLPPVPCVNHCGAGDSFAAHLTLSLAHGLPLDEAARIAHSAGRVFVQHSHGRPPYPHEVRKDLLPLGKVTTDLAKLRQSVKGKMVFTNGVFRIPHAGHTWLLRWAREQGDCLVVGINCDESAQRLRPGEFLLPLPERLEMLAALNCVDWIVPFSEDTPEQVLQQLGADVLVKGSEYAGSQVPGSKIIEDVRFAPEGIYPGHCKDLVNAIRNSPYQQEE